MSPFKNSKKKVIALDLQLSILLCHYGSCYTIVSATMDSYRARRACMVRYAPHYWSEDVLLHMLAGALGVAVLGRYLRMVRDTRSVRDQRQPKG